MLKIKWIKTGVENNLSYEHALKVFGKDTLKKMCSGELSHFVVVDSL